MGTLLKKLLGTDKMSPVGKNKLNDWCQLLLNGYAGQVLVSQGDGSTDPQWQDVPDPAFADEAGHADSADVADKANSIDAGDFNIGIKLIEIGGWDMDSFANTTVLHGLDFDKIVCVSQVLIKNDANTIKWDLGTPANTFVASNGLFNVYPSGVYLERRPGSFFDSSSYSNGSINRGWIEIKYLI